MSMMQSRTGWTEDAPVLQWKTHLKVVCITMKGNIVSQKNSATYAQAVAHVVILRTLFKGSKVQTNMDIKVPTIKP